MYATSIAFYAIIYYIVSLILRFGMLLFSNGIEVDVYNLIFNSLLLPSLIEFARFITIIVDFNIREPFLFLFWQFFLSLF